jgi:DNA gyrase subunit A
LNVNGISEMGRNTQGVTLMKIENEDRVVAVAKYVEE